jgi:enterochelin esterase-like enzyme
VHVHVQLVNTMREILTVRDWWQLPRFVYGSSRGGAMALIVAQRFPFQVGCDEFSAILDRPQCSNASLLSSS